VGAFVEWWPTSRFATPTCENAWMKELNAEALRTRLMSEALHRQVEAQNALEAAAEAAEAKRARDLQLTQPKRVQQVIGRLRKAEAAMQEVQFSALWKHATALETKAAAAHVAIRDAIEVTRAHFVEFEASELPRASAMLEAAAMIGKSAAAMVATQGLQPTPRLAHCRIEGPAPMLPESPDASCADEASLEHEHVVEAARPIVTEESDGRRRGSGPMSAAIRVAPSRAALRPLSSMSM